MKTTKVTVTGVISATVEVNNSSDETRGYDVEAMADVSHGDVTGIHSGVVTKTGTGEHVLEFSAINGRERLALTFGVASERSAALAATEEFVDEVYGMKVALAAE